jgi:lysophospholipase L1-like esterase
VKRILVGLSFLLNLAVLAGAAWLFWGGGFQQLVGRFIEPMHERWVSQFELLPVSHGDIVFLGDSITEGGSWHELFPGVPVRNRGIGGDTTAGVLDRLDQVTAGGPSKVFVKIGTNDLGRGVAEEPIVANLTTIIDRLHAEAPGSEVYVQSVLPRAAEYRERIEALNTRYARVASERGAVWIDLYPLFLAEDGSIRDELANDELHLLGAGYAIWRDRIDALVREGLPSHPVAPGDAGATSEESS